MHLTVKKTGYLAVVLSLVLFGCKVKMEEANKNFDLHQYAVASDMYKQVLKGDISKEDKQLACFRAAEGYRYTHDSKNALKYYARAIRYGMKDPIVFFREAEMLMEQEQYTEAIKKFSEYQKINPSDKEAALKIKGCELALKCADKKTRYIVESFKVANETKTDDRVPRYADRKQKSIMFTSNREGGVSKKQDKWQGRYFEDLYVTEMKGKRGREKWQAPVLVEGFTEWNEGAVTFDKRYSTMYLTQCSGLKGEQTTCKIYEAKKRGKEWELDPNPLPFCSDSFSCGHPALSADGKKLYFVSDMPGSMQDESKEPSERTKDIYVANFVRRGGTWGEPINLGPTINTKGNELFPFVHDDGTLYFSSDGHITIGGLDILFSKPKSESPTDWEEPENMGCPINSRADDFGILVDENKEHGFFSSDRARDGDDDIYEFSMTPLVIILKGTVTDCESNLPLKDALVVITNNVDSTKIRLKTDNKGYYETPLRPGVKYEITASKREDYFYDSKPKFVSTEGIDQSTEFVKDFCLRNQCDDVFVLPIYYDLDKAFLRPESKEVLQGLVETLKKYPKMSVELGSHTDCRASYEYNISLSQRRADSAVAYIISQGINPFRLEARGYGESQLTNKCECEGTKKVPCTEEEHQENRRTTVKVVNCKYEFKWSNAEVQDTNKVAIGDGPIYSAVIIDERKKYIMKHQGEYDKEIKAIEDEKKRQAEEAEKKRLAEMYDIIPLTESRDKYYIQATIGKKKIKFQYDPEGTKVEIPQNVVEQLFRSKDISVEDFNEGREKIKLTDGTKLTSNSFKVKTMDIEGIQFEKVRCKMVDVGKQPVLGNSVFSDYFGTEIKDGKLYLKKVDKKD
ncbi:MAG: OmpA family protein [Flavobacteriales bacterium]|nr:OmpA family protein [Flavobacteriales bacterium]